MSMYLAPFRPLKPTSNVTVTGASARVAIDKADAGGSVRVVNSGAAVSFVEFGDSTVVAAVATSFPVLANSVETFFLEKSQTHVAAIGTAGNTLYVTAGVGA